jgi:hypothetical protein
MDRGDLAGAGGLADAEGAAASGTAAADERVPGADPLWQAPDMSWRPLPLGLDEGWPPDPPWPGEVAAPVQPVDVAPGQPEEVAAGQPEEGAAGQAEDSSEAPGGSTVASGQSPRWATTPPSSPTGAEHSDPLPPVPDRGEPL